jgi:glyoxylase-like metal-dependent hydrolase (beta-lactamase superfamily II)
MVRGEAISPSVTDFIQVEPRGGEVATERTELWVSFDDVNVYVSFRNWESQPDRLIANEMRRDNTTITMGNDNIAFLLDTFYDRRNAMLFETNPLGARMDGQLTNERPTMDLNPVWQVKTGRFDGWWTVEAAVPFKSLRYGPTRQQVWGFNARRVNRAKNEVSFVTRLSKARGIQATCQVGQAATLVGIEAPPRSRNLEVKPYAITNVIQLHREPCRPTGGGVRHAPGGLARHLHHHAAHVRERARAVQLRQSLARDQHPVAVGVPPWQRVVRGVQRRPQHRRARVSEPGHAVVHHEGEPAAAAVRRRCLGATAHVRRLTPRHGGSTGRKQLMGYDTVTRTAMVGFVVGALAWPIAAQQGDAGGRTGGPGAGPGGRGPTGPPQIVQVAGDLYEVQTGPGVQPVTVFLVTPEGIILADPENPGVTTFLKEELARRFKVPVRYVIYSHFHWDHARGGRVFADTAKFVAHEKMAEMLKAPLSVAPPPGDTRDRNGDNRLSLDETSTGTRANFATFDADKDGFLTTAELNADIHPPDTLFSGNRHVITLGGSRVELVYTGGRHTPDVIDYYFPAERVLLASDYVWINRICCNFGFDLIPLRQWVASLRALEALDFDVLINSHWEPGTKADLVAFRRYIEELMGQVEAGIKAGRTKEELQKSVDLSQYSRYVGYPDQVPQVVGSAYDSLMRNR